MAPPPLHFPAVDGSPAALRTGSSSGRSPGVSGCSSTCDPRRDLSARSRHRPALASLGRRPTPPPKREKGIWGTPPRPPAEDGSAPSALPRRGRLPRCTPPRWTAPPLHSPAVDGSPAALPIPRQCQTTAGDGSLEAKAPRARGRARYAENRQSDRQGTSRC
jgi:hypothetical protein